jgi:hypothetical protein
VGDVVAADDLAHWLASWSRRQIASRFWCSVSFGLRPSLTPRALARSRPSLIRARIKSLWLPKITSGLAHMPRSVTLVAGMIDLLKLLAQVPGNCTVRC